MLNGLIAGVVNANRPAEASSAPAAVDVVVPHNAPQVLRVTLQGVSGPVSFEFGVPPGAAPGTKLRVEVPQQVRERLAPPRPRAAPTAEEREAARAAAAAEREEGQVRTVLERLLRDVQRGVAREEAAAATAAAKAQQALLRAEAKRVEAEAKRVAALARADARRAESERRAAERKAESEVRSVVQGLVRAVERAARKPARKEGARRVQPPSFGGRPASLPTAAAVPFGGCAWPIGPPAWPHWPPHAAGLAAGQVLPPCLPPHLAAQGVPPGMAVGAGMGAGMVPLYAPMQSPAELIYFQGATWHGGQLPGG